MNENPTLSPPMPGTPTEGIVVALGRRPAIKAVPAHMEDYKGPDGINRMRGVPEVQGRPEGPDAVALMVFADGARATAYLTFEEATALAVKLIDIKNAWENAKVGRRCPRCRVVANEKHAEQCEFRVVQDVFVPREP